MTPSCHHEELGGQGARARPISRVTLGVPLLGDSLCVTYVLSELPFCSWSANPVMPLAFQRWLCCALGGNLGKQLDFQDLSVSASVKHLGEKKEYAVVTLKVALTIQIPTMMWKIPPGQILR